MLIRYDKLVDAIGTTLDIVESQLLGVATNHGKRLALLCTLMCQALDLSTESGETIVRCAFFHDNALTEYIASLKATPDQEEHFLNHCIMGQQNVELLPFQTDPTGLVLYHHERADGKGLFGLKEGEIPLGAALIAAADHLDATYDLLAEDVEIEKVKGFILSQRGNQYTTTAADALLKIMSPALLLQLRHENIQSALQKHIPILYLNLTEKEMFQLSKLCARIIDFHSQFTRNHSLQIANKAWVMGLYYGYDSKKCAKLYLAAAFHDIGKLAIPNKILDKPGALTEEEFTIIKSHVAHSYRILDGIEGLEEIRDWVGNHHEKLDGGGYFRGKEEKELDFISRLLAVTDIYQAITEERPYHVARSHTEAMPILQDMAAKGQIDKNIVADFSKVMADYDSGLVPEPERMALV